MYETNSNPLTSSHESIFICVRNFLTSCPRLHTSSVFHNNQQNVSIVSKPRRGSKSKTPGKAKEEETNQGDLAGHAETKGRRGGVDDEEIPVA